ncbi:FkbH-like protein [Aliiruegeria haliotis]|uniref:FkbH-like protein n=1 Tax=Aliiruegeria haliotis TaxID=1280846 RepID=A0A2T0RLA2_9RHOB|nr:hypothetical protein [Aliiruegeria haliotis]PRY21911.1 FkbH-like protein [Aliiruegeria haliotis]
MMDDNAMQEDATAPVRPMATDTSANDFVKAPAQITSTVKLVIWDLDETFWNGTLSEGGIEPVEAHTQMVRTLADRGILSSICSKNDSAAAKAELEALGIWEFFVFPHIDWTPKGQAIGNILKRAQLRAPNVLFLDDNPMNLEEAAFFNEGLLTYDARQDLLSLLDMPGLQGKDDREHARLKQYRMLEAKQSDQDAGALDNIDFLRQSDIKVEIVADFAPHMDRVLELINRTNQLNYTKNRVETDEARQDLEALLSTVGVHAGLVRVSDRYGDYGFVGFFVTRLQFDRTTVHHFCFSCRTLNMGVEQFIWERIGSPSIQVRTPVANPVKSFDTVDWITEVASADRAFSDNNQRSLCLVGGCDLQQVSFYCGSRRAEFVNTERDGYLVRYDDPGFFLNPRPPLRNSQVLKKFPTWSWQDMVDLDTALAESDVILLSLYFALTGGNFFSFGGEKWGGEYLLKVPPRTLRKYMRSEEALWFAKAFYHRPMAVTKAASLVYKSFLRAAALSGPESRIFVITAVTKTGPQAERTRETRSVYNRICADFCAKEPKAQLVDLDHILPLDDIQDSDHYTRAGYFRIAKFVNETMDAHSQRSRTG